MKLSYWTDITEKRDCGKTTVNQRLLIEIDYNHKEQTFTVENVWIIEGCIKFEVSKLLTKAEGNPLHTILSAIDWAQVYSDYKDEQNQSFSRLPNYNNMVSGLTNNFFGGINTLRNGRTNN